MAKFKGNQKSRERLAYEMVLKSKINKVMPELYACFCLTLKEYYKWSDQDIVDCLSASGVLWRDCSVKAIDMIQWCKDSTGIDCKLLLSDNPETAYDKEKVIFEGNINE